MTTIGRRVTGDVVHHALEELGGKKRSLSGDWRAAFVRARDRMGKEQPRNVLAAMTSAMGFPRVTVSAEAREKIARVPGALGDALRLITADPLEFMALLAGKIAPREGSKE